MVESHSIKMKIKSLRYDVEANLFSSIAQDIDESEFDGEFDENNLSSGEEAIELNTEGRMNSDDKKVELVYDESEITGMKGAKTYISFEKDNPGFISMMRNGTVSTALIFEKGKRHHCVYNTPIMPFELCVRTLTVDNKILENGKLILDYIIEIRGAKAERTKFELTVID